uniref:NADH-ubiquinone oxidoreductase chain 4L n=1 Tax=Scirtidae sp. BMNH 1274304 TaxID=1796542 RepID=A0A126TFD3_9COLE|nr:NADH dehydrogenase subunit 4L [Scirtidae sp. BMNH 1274304]
MLNLLFVGMILLLFSIMCFCIQRKHLLNLLLSLEFIVLSLFFMMILLLLNYNNELYFLMLFILFSVCEGVLGLSVMVSIVRSHGNDFFYNMNILW